MENDFNVEELATKTKAIGDPLRTSILHLLSIKGALNVSDISKWLHVSNSVASHHLKILSLANLVESGKSGNYTIYWLSEGGLRETWQMLVEITSQMEETKRLNQEKKHEDSRHTSPTTENPTIRPSGIRENSFSNDLGGEGDPV